MAWITELALLTLTKTITVLKPRIPHKFQQNNLNIAHCSIDSAPCVPTSIMRAIRPGTYRSRLSRCVAVTMLIFIISISRQTVPNCCFPLESWGVAALRESPKCQVFLFADRAEVLLIWRNLSSYWRTLSLTRLRFLRRFVALLNVSISNIIRYIFFWPFSFNDRLINKSQIQN